MHPLETYLHDLNEIYRTGGGVEEESYYGALEKLFNEVGSRLKPKVRAVPQLKNTGGGEPDFGLYTASQFQRTKDARPVEGTMPERGVVEVKGWSDDTLAQTKSEQVAKYRKKYSLVLVTNCRDFVLVGKNRDGKAARLESYHLASSEQEFRKLLQHPRIAAKEQGERFVEFLQRVLLAETGLTNPEDLAKVLASYAREARYRVEEKPDLPALAGLKEALEEALGMKFEGEKGQHFFQATLVQTLFYGIFSSWVLWSRDINGDRTAHFDWHAASWTLHVPMVKSLFEQIATSSKLKPLGVDEVLDWAGATLNRVDRKAFFKRFEEQHAVQYFYEPFLKAYDPQLRKDLGVWYTPPEIVQYQVERVDRVLREELDIADGLADDQVVILDPCCGTGAYLVETLKRIHKTLDEKGGSALVAQKLKTAAIKRVFGFEILPAPFVVSHLQLGLMLRLLGAPLDHDSDERVGVFLTNALTGWEPPKDPKKNLSFSFAEIAEEADRANDVKRDTPILVILGNPPYNAFAGTSPEEEGGLVDIYKEGLTKPVKEGGWGIKKFNLDDLYVRFFRIAERRITQSGKGVISYISNFSYLGDPSFVVMRQKLLESFDKMWLDCMNGDSRETGKQTPDGKPDPSVFSTEQSRVGIRVGTAIGLLVRKERRAKTPVVRFMHYWGVNKRRELLKNLELAAIDRKYDRAHPDSSSRFSFKPASVSLEYSGWPTPEAIAKSQPHNGPIERRGNSLIVFEDQCDSLRERLSCYLDEMNNDQDVESIAPEFMHSSGEFDAMKTRSVLKGELAYSAANLKRYPFKPFDIRFAYLDVNIAPLFSRPSPQLLQHNTIVGNGSFITRDSADKSIEGPPFWFSDLVCDYDFLSGHARHFPVRLREEPAKRKEVTGADDMFGEQQAETTITANLSATARLYLHQLGITKPDKDAQTAGLIWMHALAIGYSPLYLSENADGIRQDWPRIPLPAKKNLLLKSAELGRQIAALLDTEKPVVGVTTGTLNALLIPLGVVKKVGGGSLDPTAGEFDLTAGWGHAGARGVCMPGKGKYDLTKQHDPDLKKAFGKETLNVYLNDVAFWENVPKPVWDYTIGGYQVIKKWLSYREKSMLGRGLTLQEAEYVTEMVRRIAALILLQPELDKNYQTVKSDTWPWPKQ